MHYHKIINNNQQSYIVIPKEIREKLGLFIGSWAKITVQGNSMIVTKTSEPPKKEVNLEGKEYNVNSPKNKSNQPNSTQSNSIVISEDQLKQKIFDILDQSQVISLSELIQKINIDDKEVLISVLRNLLEENEITGYEQPDGEIYLSVKIR